MLVGELSKGFSPTPINSYQLLNELAYAFHIVSRRFALSADDSEDRPVFERQRGEARPEDRLRRRQGRRKRQVSQKALGK